MLILQNWAASPGTTQQVIAPWIGNLSVTGRADNRRTALDETLAGDMDAALVLSDAGPGGFSLRIGTVAGTADSITAAANIGNFTAGISGDISANAIGSVTTRASRRAGGVTGSVTDSTIVATGVPTQQGRAAIGTIRIVGDVTNLIVESEQGSLGNVTIVGDATNVQVLSAGSIRTVTVGGMLDTGRIQSLGSVSGFASCNEQLQCADRVRTGVRGRICHREHRLRGRCGHRCQAGQLYGRHHDPRPSDAADHRREQPVGRAAWQRRHPRPGSDTADAVAAVSLLTDATGGTPSSVRYIDRATPANSFSWRRGQTQPELLQAMLHAL